MASGSSRATETDPGIVDAPVVTVTRQQAETVVWDGVEIVGTVEWALEYGGDYQVDATGAPVLVYDAPGDPAATDQRIGIMLRMTPSYTDDEGVPFAADDVNFPAYGAGLTVRVDELWSPQLEADITTDIVNSLSDDPGLDPSVAPTVVFETEDPLYAPTVTYQTVAGDYATLPSFNVLTGE